MSNRKRWVFLIVLCTFLIYGLPNIFPKAFPNWVTDMSSDPRTLLNAATNFNIEMRVRIADSMINITSLDDTPFTITGVIVNNYDPACQGLLKLNPAMTDLYERLGFTKPPWTLKIGQTQRIAVVGCNPVKIEIVTDRGTKIYKFREEE
jgi:hypothetical protein